MQLVATASYLYGYSYNATEDVEWSFSPTSPALNVTSVTATATLGTVHGDSAAQTVSVSRANPLLALYSMEDGDPVDVYGVYVGFSDGNGPVIMDGEYGMLCFDKTANVSSYTAGTTVLHVTGTMGSSPYGGIREIMSPTFSVASGEYDAPDAPVTYAAKGEETIEYSSRLTTVTGIATCTKNDFSGDPGASDITMSFAVGTKTVTVFYKKAAQEADTDAYASMKNAVANGTQITVKGFTSWYNSFQVQMNGVVQEVITYTAEQFSQDLLNQTDAVCSLVGEKTYDQMKTALAAIWTNLSSSDKYPSLPAAQKTILAEAERNESGTVVEQAMARYDRLTGKYNLSNFIVGRTPMVGQVAGLDYSAPANSNTSTIIIVAVALTSITSIGVLLVIKRKRSLVK